MSRLVKYPINIPAGIKCTLKDNIIQFVGPVGVEVYNIPKNICHVVVEDNKIVVSAMSGAESAMCGTIRQLIQNACTGAAVGFSKTLTLKGVGYKASVNGNILKLDIGLSHSVKYTVPENISISIEKNTEIILKSSNKAQVGQVAAEIRSKRVPERYKGAGIHIAGQHVIIR